MIHRPATAAAPGIRPFAAGCTALQLAWGEQARDALTGIAGLPEGRGIRMAASRSCSGRGWTRPT